MSPTVVIHQPDRMHNYSIIQDEQADLLAAKLASIIEAALVAPQAEGARTAALDIDATYTDFATRTPPTPNEDFLVCLWKIFAQIGGSLPHVDNQQDPLILIAKELHKLPVRIITMHTFPNKAQLWQGLEWFEAGIPQPWEARSALGERSRSELINKHALAAKLFGLGLVGLALDGMVVLRQVVEGVEIEHNGQRVVSATPTDIEHLDIKTAIAATWIQYAALPLLGYDEGDEVLDGGPLWQEARRQIMESGDHFSADELHYNRWVLWKGQFEAIADCPDVDAETRAIAYDAFTTMERLG
ncbi:hypothetical protein BDV28DRAFT_146966 [Aspergillus coremiiformis]|uniref:Uncharacterized protein n=1 Tax=Aspergillus coremiiformis TaxID=138285 RepID=A0A5N6ZCX6_9EURO|nr:hypothetical protein BDV28DRAFT_146966 [Aspergillus coremiiformis]